MDSVKIDALVQAYRNIRAAKEELTKGFEAELGNLESEQDVVSSALKGYMLEAGLKSLKTEQGTVSLLQKTRYFTNDWEEFDKFVIEHKATSLFERRIAQTNLKTFLEDNPGVIPPGLNSESKYEISVRKPT